MGQDSAIFTQNKFDMSQALEKLSPDMLSNPIFKFELSKIVRDYGIKLSIKVLDEGRKLVVYEKPLKTTGDDVDTLSSNNYCITITPNLDLISTRQYGIITREHNNRKNGSIKYNMESCLYTRDGVELNRVTYSTSNPMNTMNDFGTSTLSREINNRMPQIKFMEGKTDFNPGLYAFNGEVMCYSRRIDNLGITNVLWKKINGANFLNSTVEEQIMEDSIYQVNPYQPGVIRTYGEALNKICHTQGELKGMIDSANMQLYNGANDYGADAVREYMNQYMNFERKVF